MKNMKMLSVAMFVILSLAMSVSLSANEAVEVVKKLYVIADGKPYNAQALGELFADNFKDHNSEGNQEGVSDRDASIYFYGQLAKGFPDAKHTFEMLEPIGKDRAMLYWDYSGTNTGSFFGAPPSGNRVSIKGVEIFRVKDGKIVDMWHIEELAKMEKQLQGKAH